MHRSSTTTTKTTCHIRRFLHPQHMMPRHRHHLRDVIPRYRILQATRLQRRRSVARRRKKNYTLITSRNRLRNPRRSIACKRRRDLMRCLPRTQPRALPSRDHLEFQLHHIQMGRRGKSRHTSTPTHPNNPRPARSLPRDWAFYPSNPVHRLTSPYSIQPLSNESDISN